MSPLTQSRLLSVVLLLVAVYNTYLLFGKRRTYRLWYRDESVRSLLIQEVLRNPHASLEEPPRDPPQPRSWGSLVRYVPHLRRDVVRGCARQVPILEWFVAPVPVRATPRTSARVYTLRVWDVLDAPLYVFAYVPKLT